MTSKWIQVDSRELRRLVVAADMLEYFATTPAPIQTDEALDYRRRSIIEHGEDVIYRVRSIADQAPASFYERMGGTTVAVIMSLYALVAFLGGYLASFIYLATFH